MTTGTPHIAVCVCTYKRPGSLARLLESLGDQETNGSFTYSLVIVDNDREQSARGIVSRFEAASAVPVTYCVEPRQSIPLARNMAIERAVGEYVALVDDDEWPAGRMWLLTLFRTLGEHAADGVLGPVIPRYAEGSPQWLIDGKFYERPAHATGSRLTPLQCRTGNALLRTSVFAAVGAPSFRFEIPYGEDRDFFRRAVERRQVFIWCAEAGVFEEVPPGRWKRSFMLKMALLRGQTSLRRSTSAPTDVATSVVAVPCYALALPIALVLGHHRFMSCLVRLCDHLGRLMAVAGVGAIKHPYVSD